MLVVDLKQYFYLKFSPSKTAEDDSMFLLVSNPSIISYYLT